MIREGAFYSNKVENLLPSTVVADVSSNQLSIPYYAFHIRSALNQEIPLAFNLAVHFFCLRPLLSQKTHFIGKITFAMPASGTHFSYWFPFDNFTAFVN
jgi:hypothetical protein